MHFQALRRVVKAVMPTFVAVIALIVLPASFLMNQSGAPAARTGAPGDGDGSPGNNGSCADVGCHNTYPINSGVGSVSIDAPSQYTTDTPIEFTVTVEDTSRFRFGFQTTIKNSSAQNTGTFELIDSNTRFATGNPDYVTHTLANSNNQWTVKWTPPAGLAEDVTIYAAGNAADGRFTAASDYTYETELLVQYAQPSSTEEPAEAGFNLDVYPNPSSGIVNIDLEVTSPGRVEVEIVDLLGRRVAYVAPAEGHSLTHQIPVDVSSFVPGIYMARISKGETSKSVAFVVGR